MSSIEHTGQYTDETAVKEQPAGPLRELLRISIDLGAESATICVREGEDPK